MCRALIGACNLMLCDMCPRFTVAIQAHTVGAVRDSWLCDAEQPLGVRAIDLHNPDCPALVQLRRHPLPEARRQRAGLLDSGFTDSPPVLPRSPTHYRPPRRVPLFFFAPMVAMVATC